MSSKSLKDLIDLTEKWNDQTGQIRENTIIEWDNDHEYRYLAAKIFQEEACELVDAIKDNDLVETVDAIGDVLFTLFGITSKAGLNHLVEDIYLEVVRSNNSKLEGSEKTSTKKIGKGKNYSPPNFKSILAQR